jgi:hypothetical protein
MYHRPLGLSSHNLNRPRGVLSAQNENILQPSSKSAGASSSTSKSKTPLGSRPRRAFGDISNKKSSNANTGGGGTKENNNNKSIVLKPRSSAAFTPRSTNTLPVSRIPKLTSHSSKPKSNSKLPTTIKAPTRPIGFPVPRTQLKAPSANTKATTTTTTNVATLKKHVLPVDDVELPAGRLWVDQQHDDDELSTSSMGDDLLDRRTMWDDWRLSVRQHYQDVEELARHQDRDVQQQIEQLLKDEDGTYSGGIGIITCVHLNLTFSVFLLFMCCRKRIGMFVRWGRRFGFEQGYQHHQFAGRR